MRARIWTSILAMGFLVTTTSGLAQSSGPNEGKQVQAQRQKQVQQPQAKQNQSRSRVKDGTCTGDPANGQKQGQKAKKGRTLGPGDGTGNQTPPKNGTGYGSPNQGRTNKAGNGNRGRRGGGRG